MSDDPALDPNLDAAKLSREDWLSVLTPIEFSILRDHGTERPGSGRYLKETRPGAYHCAGCGLRLYDAQTKFHSGCGWPSFFQEAQPAAIRTLTDTTHGMVRTEMRCSGCDGHLGHIFADAPDQPSGVRHCVNGFALVFVPEGESAADVLFRHRKRA